MREITVWTCRCGMRYKAATERAQSANQRSLVICEACRCGTTLQNTLIYHLWQIGIEVDEASAADTELSAAV